MPTSPRFRSYSTKGRPTTRLLVETRSLAAHGEPVVEQGLALPPLCRPGDAGQHCRAGDLRRKQDWTARDLLDMGMSPEVAARTLQLLENATEIGSVRIREWFSKYIPLAAETPEVWAATIAFFQIIAKDIHNPALATLGELMHGSVPWKDGQLRRRYNRLARPLLREARVEFQDFLTFTPEHREEGRTPATGDMRWSWKP